MGAGGCRLGMPPHPLPPPPPPTTPPKPPPTPPPPLPPNTTTTPTPRTHTGTPRGGRAWNRRWNPDLKEYRANISVFSLIRSPAAVFPTILALGLGADGRLVRPPTETLRRPTETQPMVKLGNLTENPEIYGGPSCCTFGALSAPPFRAGFAYLPFRVGRRSLVAALPDTNRNSQKPENSRIANRTRNFYGALSLEGCPAAVSPRIGGFVYLPFPRWAPGADGRPLRAPAGSSGR